MHGIKCGDASGAKCRDGKQKVAGGKRKSREQAGDQSNGKPTLRGKCECAGHINRVTLTKIESWAAAGQRQSFRSTALTHDFSYRVLAVASVECYEKSKETNGNCQ